MNIVSVHSLASCSILTLSEAPPLFILSLSRLLLYLLRHIQQYPTSELLFIIGVDLPVPSVYSWFLFHSSVTLRFSSTAFSTCLYSLLVTSLCLLTFLWWLGHVLGSYATSLSYTSFWINIQNMFIALCSPTGHKRIILDLSCMKAANLHSTFL
jgi:hypothetical protein